MRPRTIAGAVLAVFALAAVDGNITHWSRPATGAAAPVPAAPPVAAGPVGTTGWVVPLPVEALGGPLDAPHHDYPAVDIPVAAGTPIAAMQAGTVAYVGGTCGLGIAVAGDGVAVKVCHASRRLVAEGATVAAGQHIADAGSTGNSDGPHAHFEVRAGGALRRPGPLLAALYAGRSVPDPASLPATGCVS